MKSDFGSILVIIISFLIFTISVATLYFFIINSSKNLYMESLEIARQINNIQSENLIFLNNETIYNNITLEIKNIGTIPINLKCFNLFVNGYPTNFNYTIIQYYPSQFLLSNEIAKIYFNQNYKNNTWNYIILVDCYGKKYQTLLYINS